MYYDNNFAIIVPMANEEKGFSEFINALTVILDRLNSGNVFIIIDKVSKDNTLQLSENLSKNDNRFHTIWAPENKNIVDAYMRGYKEAYEKNFDIIIEMDAGLSHDPRAIPMFLRVLNEGNECAFGSRFINGGSIWDSTFFRTVLSRGGTILSNVLLGTRLYDMTSGYQAFHRDVVKVFLEYSLLSTGHFYQTELRYLLRKKRFAEIPIHYRAPSPSVSKKAILNSIKTLFYYTANRFIFKTKIIN